MMCYGCARSPSRAAYYIIPVTILKHHNRNDEVTSLSDGAACLGAAVVGLVSCYDRGETASNTIRVAHASTATIV